MSRMTELITSDLICPSTYQLLQNSSGDFRPDFSFGKSASPEHLFGIARASLVAVSKLYFSFGCFGGDYTSSCPPTGEEAWHLENENQSPCLHKVWKTLKKGHRRLYLQGLTHHLKDVAIDDPRLTAGSFNMADVHRLSAHVIKLRDMPKGVLVLFGLSQVWKNHLCDPVVRGADGNVMGIHDFLCLLEWTDAEVQEEPHLDDLAAGTPSSKILAKAEASQKRKASTSGSTSRHVAKHTRSALAQSFDSTTWPSLFAG
nr:hypothetical protein [Tanacetum cinerariifolium]